MSLTPLKSSLFSTAFAGASQQRSVKEKLEHLQARETFPREALVNREFKLDQGRNLPGAKISDYCMDFKKQSHLFSFVVSITALRDFILELDL